MSYLNHENDVGKVDLEAAEQEKEYIEIYSDEFDRPNSTRKEYQELNLATMDYNTSATSGHSSSNYQELSKVTKSNPQEVLPSERNDVNITKDTEGLNYIELDHDEYIRSDYSGRQYQSLDSGTSNKQVQRLDSGTYDIQYQSLDRGTMDLPRASETSVANSSSNYLELSKDRSENSVPENKPPESDDGIVTKKTQGLNYVEVCPDENVMYETAVHEYQKLDPDTMDDHRTSNTPIANQSSMYQELSR